MRVFVTGGTGHSGSYIIPELIAAGHEVTGLARSDASAAAVSALGAKVRRGDLQDLDGLKEAAADSDGVIHVAHRQDLLPSGGLDAVAAAELPIMLAYGEALAGTGKPLVTAGSIGSPGNLGRPATEEDPALPTGEEHKGTLRVRNIVERAVVDLAEQGVRSSVVRIANIAHSTTDRAGFLPTLIALAKEKGFVGYPGDGANLWNAVHIRDAATLFRLALEKGPTGKYWHAVEDGGIPFQGQLRLRPDAVAGGQRGNARGDHPGAATADPAVHRPGHRPARPSRHRRCPAGAGPGMRQRALTGFGRDHLCGRPGAGPQAPPAPRAVPNPGSIPDPPAAGVRGPAGPRRRPHRGPWSAAPTWTPPEPCVRVPEPRSAVTAAWRRSAATKCGGSHCATWVPLRVARRACGSGWGGSSSRRS
ncbi:hypothetical protein SANTM175S_09375 [Streptomyces antimycoticus]